MTKAETARIIAGGIDRLACLLAPYEYYDVVGRTEKEFAANVRTIARDLVSGDAAHYMAWLEEQAADNCNDERDRQRAAYWLDMVRRFMADY
jgi:hypothetical protein